MFCPRFRHKTSTAARCVRCEGGIRRETFAVTWVSLAIIVMSLNLPAHAQAVRFIGSTGNEANNCTRQAPCLTLQRGIDETPDRGVLQVLDGGAYGAGTIIRSITVLGD